MSTSQMFPPGDRFWDHTSKFFCSYWFTRGWTLQELLAPKLLHFYDQTWTFLGSKRDLSDVIQAITRIPPLFLLGSIDLSEASIAQRMSWATNRATKRTEDIAYCLLGIFGVEMPIIYGGDGNKAFGRLQQEIMKVSRDHSILAWGLQFGECVISQSENMISRGALASSPSDFANCGHIVPRKQHIRPVDIFEIVGGYLRARLPLYTTSSGKIYGLLNCGQENNAEIVGIPLNNVISSEQSDEYIRPDGHHSILLGTRASSNLTATVYIMMERVRTAMNRQNWFYIEESTETNLELVEVYPTDRWKDRAMISTPNNLGGNIVQQSFARFRRKDVESRDLIAVLEYEVQRSQVQARCHVMISSKTTALDDLSRKLIYLKKEILGKKGASDGRFSVEVTVKHETIAGQTMFAVRLAPSPIPPAATVDATLELQQLYLKLDFVKNLQEQDKILPEQKLLDQHRFEKMVTLERTRDHLVAVQESLRKLTEEERSLIDKLEKEDQELHQLTIQANEMAQRRAKLSDQGLEIERSLDELRRKSSYIIETPNWFEGIIKKLLDADKTDAESKNIEQYGSTLADSPSVVESENNLSSKIPLWWAAINGHQAVLKRLLEDGVDLEAKDKYGRTALSRAAREGYQKGVESLIESGANLDSKDMNGWTPLSWAAYNGHETVVESLLEKGANLESRDESGWTPLLWAAHNGHEIVVELLLEKGANLESGDDSGGTPLSWAAHNGHETVVELFLKKGANLESGDDSGGTPLSWAAHNGHEMVVKLLLKKGANLEAEIADGRTPLLLAISHGHDKVVKLLLEEGAETESRKSSWKPLSLAAQNGHDTIIKILLEKGADSGAVEKQDMTPLSLAVKNGHKMSANQLRSAEQAQFSNTMTYLSAKDKSKHPFLEHTHGDRDGGNPVISGRTTVFGGDKNGYGKGVANNSTKLSNTARKWRWRLQ